MPTDEGLHRLPGLRRRRVLASPGTLLEWRVRAIELAQEGRVDETALDLRWLTFELRRARDALTELVALIDDLDESPVRTRMRFVANGALNLYEAAGREPAAPKK